MKDFSDSTYKELFNMAMECLMAIIDREGSCYGMYDIIDPLEHIYNNTNRLNDDEFDSAAESDMYNFIMSRFMRKE